MKKINILGAPLDMGASKRGVRLGAWALRLSGIISRLKNLGYEVFDNGDIFVRDNYENDFSYKNLNNYEVVRDANRNLYLKLKEIQKEGVSLLLGGDHSLGIGSIKASLENYDDLCVVWIDAHADINTDFGTPSGNIHGMSLASVMGLGTNELSNIVKTDKFLKPENLIYIGIRDLDYEEKETIKKYNIKNYTMTDICEKSLGVVMREVCEFIKTKKHLHVSFDIDSVDSYFVPGTGTRVSYGLSPSETRFILEKLSQTDKLVSCDLVEVNPLLDEKNKTAELATSLILALFGDKLL